MSIFLHNLTKNIFNETDIGDFVETLEKGDKIMYTESGNALIEPFMNLDKWTRNQLYESFYEFHGESYL